MIKINALSKYYGPHAVLDDITLDLQKGGLTAIIGPNGAGKSTLLSAIARLTGFEQGTISLDGLDVAKTKGEIFAKRLSILKQDNSVMARLKVEDLVGFGRYPHSKTRLTALDRQKIEEALDYLDLKSLRHRFLDELSGGQRQRAFVAMALCQDSDYMLLDEPLNNLDIQHAVAMMKLLKKAATELKKAVIVVLHDINFASCYSDYVIAMKHGRLHSQGEPQTMMSKERLEDIYETPFSIEIINGQRIALYY